VEIQRPEGNFFFAEFFAVQSGVEVLAVEFGGEIAKIFPAVAQSGPATKDAPSNLMAEPLLCRSAPPPKAQKAMIFPSMKFPPIPTAVHERRTG
jgi:hypothetical protein